MVEPVAAPDEVTGALPPVCEEAEVPAGAAALDWVPPDPPGATVAVAAPAPGTVVVVAAD
jgi:hypothetical protein